MKTISNIRGVTLIEIVSSLGILAIGIVSLLALFPLALEETARTGDRTTAALLGEYVIEQVRLHQDKISGSGANAAALTDDALKKDVLNWEDYQYDDDNDPAPESFTFDATKNPVLGGGYGSGEQIIKQDVAELTGLNLYSRYEVTLRFDEIEGASGPNDGFTDAGDKALMQVTVTVRWPRALTNEERAKQDTMSFVTYIRTTTP